MGEKAFEAAVYDRAKAQVVVIKYYKGVSYYEISLETLYTTISISAGSQH